MNILDQLNSGALHSKARASRPDCVDVIGNIHGNADRAAFVNWLLDAKKRNGSDVSKWTDSQREEYADRHVSV